MPAQTYYIVQAFTAQSTGLFAEAQYYRPSPEAARKLATELATRHAGVVAWSQYGDPDLDMFDPPVVIVKYGRVPEDFG